MKKKIVFLDGDGTLWYPKSTRRTKAPHWIYAESKSMKSALRNLQLIPGTLSVLKELRKRGAYLVVVSTHPFPMAISKRILDEKIRYFKLETLVDEWHPAIVHPNGKATVFKRILKKKGIKKSEALHVGDSYTYDYLAAQTAGIAVRLFDTPYLKRRPRAFGAMIRRLGDIL